MLTPTNIKGFYSLIVLILLPLQLFGQRDHAFALQNKASIKIDLDTTITDDAQLEPFDSQLIISGLAFSGDIVLYSDSSLVRMILMDADDNEYLIYEAYPILSGTRQFSVNEAAEETALLKNITPTRVTIELVDAFIHLKEFIISEGDGYQAATKGAIVLQQSQTKIDRINRNIQDLGWTWVAGETSISRLSYQEKKTLFGGSIPNFQGFEYYVGGVFVLPGALGDGSGTKGTTSEYHLPYKSRYPFEFSWQQRHGTNWVTPAKHQDHCSSCTAFGTVAAVELLVNLYFNWHLDYDLSEQNIVSCTEGSCEYGWNPQKVLDYIKNTGIVLEDCFPYTASDEDCSEKCSDPSEQIKIDHWEVSDITIMGEDLKREIITGAATTTMIINSWNHHIQIIGYKMLEPGDNYFIKRDSDIVEVSIGPDDPLLGETAWLIKNSGGESWGIDGFGYVVVGESDVSVFSLFGPVSSLVLDESNISCTDHDSDGSYYWGIGPKPNHCPDCPDEEDGDDSDPCIRSLDEFGNLVSITPKPDGQDTIILFGQAIPDLYVSGHFVRWYSDRKLQNLVHTGNLFPTGHTDPGNYTYYVTQTLSHCESVAKDISLSIVTGIPPPTGHDTVIIKGESAVLFVEGERGAEFRWYEDPALTILLNKGETYKTAKTAIGKYTYYVTQTLCLIESPADTVILEIAENVSIPDSAFLNALIYRGVDTNGDNLINYVEAAAKTLLNVSRCGISDMTGIQAFVNLSELICDNNELTNLDVSNNTLLENLDCRWNNLTSLDVSGCTALGYLRCEGNQLTSLDVSGCNALEYLHCVNNQLTSLDVSGCKALRYLYCYNNQLTSLDVSNNTLLENLDCGWNNLTSLDVSGCTALGYLDCGSNQLTSLDVSGCTALTSLYCRWNNLTILDVSGCTALTSLYYDDNQLTNLNVSGCTALPSLDCYNNQLTSLDVSGCTALEYLHCVNNQLTRLDVSNNTLLENLDCGWNNLTSLDVSGCTALEYLHCVNNQLTRLDVSGCTALGYLDCGSNQLTSLNASKNTALTELLCMNNQLTSLDVSNNTALRTLSCLGNQLTSLDVSNNTLLENLDCGWNNLTSLDVSGCTALGYLDCGSNQLTSLDVSGCTALGYLDCGSNQLTSLNTSKNAALTELLCMNNQLTSLDVSNNTALRTLSCLGNQLTSLDVSNNIALYRILIGDMPSLEEVCVWTIFPIFVPFPLAHVNVDTTGSPNVDFRIDCGYNIYVYIPDTAFLHALIDEGVDTDGDSLISYEEAEAVETLNVTGRYISSMVGIEAFSNLDTLSCATFLGTRDGMGEDERPNFITHLNLSGNTKLKYLDCSYNSFLTGINVSNCIELTHFICSGNQLTGLDVSKNTFLDSLFCAYTQITSLDLSNNPALVYLDCGESELEDLNVTNNQLITHLECDHNLITNLDLTKNTELKYLICSATQLRNLNISNNLQLSGIWIENIPTLYEVCVWTTPFPPEGVDIDSTGSPNVYFTNKCSGSTELFEFEYKKFTIFPNPTNTILTIETGILDPYNINITSLNGQLLFSKEMEGTTHQLDLSSFQKGVYLITIRSEDFVTTKKIIKL